MTKIFQKGIDHIYGIWYIKCGQGNHVKTLYSTKGGKRDDLAK
jgi:hypothetical protein